LSCELSSVFDSNDGSPHAEEFISGSWLEAIISSNWSWSIVRWSSGNLRVSKSIVGKESFLEFSSVKFSITGTIVSGNEKINFFGGWEDVDCVQTGFELVGVDGSVSWDIEDLEGISYVKVVLLGKGNLGVLKVLLSIAHVFQSVDELIFVVDSQDWLP